MIKQEINAVMKNPDSLADPVLRREVQQCIDGDDAYSPDITLAKQLMGHEYELRLHLYLVNSGVPFICTPRARARARTRCLAKAHCTSVRPRRPSATLLA